MMSPEMNLQESSKEKVSASELHDVQLKPEFVEAFCKILIKNEGERRGATLPSRTSSSMS